MSNVVVGFLSKDQIESAADRCLASCHADRSTPIPIERIVELHYRIDVVPTSRLELDFDTIAFISQDLTEIRVDSGVLSQARTNPGRLNFSLAHELGHVVLHAGIFEHLRFDDLADFGRALDDMSEEDYRWMEWQADYFAGAVLMPRTEFRSRIDDVLVQVAQAMGVGSKQFRDLPEPAQEYAVKALGREFKVSPGTVWKRLRALAIL